MELIDTSIECLTPIPREQVYKAIELYGRVAYKSEDRITEDSASNFVANLISRGHESVLEHVSLTFRLITDRATAYAWVRHRIAAYTQESTIYCDYKKKGIMLRDPFFLEGEALEVWKEAMEACEKAYYRLRDLGVSPGKARDVLPNALKTELIATHNIREWRHILQCRMAPGDSPGMHKLVAKIFTFLYMEYPILFKDIVISEPVADLIARSLVCKD